MITPNFKSPAMEIGMKVFHSLHNCQQFFAGSTVVGHSSWYFQALLDNWRAGASRPSHATGIFLYTRVNKFSMEVPKSMKQGAAYRQMEGMRACNNNNMHKMYRNMG